jgi:hypothetical protein
MHTNGVRAYNVGSGTPRTVGEMAAALADALKGRNPEVTGQYRLGDVRHITADSSRLRTELDWRPQIEFRGGYVGTGEALKRGGGRQNFQQTEPPFAEHCEYTCNAEIPRRSARSNRHVFVTAVPRHWTRCISWVKALNAGECGRPRTVIRFTSRQISGSMSGRATTPSCVTQPFGHESETQTG